MSTADEQFLSFIATRVSIAPNDRVRAIDLYRAYEEWQAAQAGPDDQGMTVTAFGRRMATLPGTTRKRMTSGNVYQGIKIR